IAAAEPLIRSCVAATSESTGRSSGATVNIDNAETIDRSSLPGLLKQSLMQKAIILKAIISIAILAFAGRAVAADKKQKEAPPPQAATRPANGSLFTDDGRNVDLLSDFKPRFVG